MLEQQRAIKMNEKNEAQVKKLAEEIRGIKAQKVSSCSFTNSFINSLIHSCNSTYLLYFFHLHNVSRQFDPQNGGDTTRWYLAVF